MRSRKAWAIAIMFALVIAGGGAVGLTGSLSPGNELASAGAGRPTGSTQVVEKAVTAAAAGISPFPQGPSFSFGAQGAAVTMTTTVAGATTVVASSTVGGPMPPQTVLLQPNGNQAQHGPSKAGLPLATTTGVNGSRDIEFFTNITLVASSASSAFAKATVIAYSVGGYISFSTETNSSALVVMRVPAANYQDALAQVEGLGTLVSLRSSSNDVTVQYTDMNATLMSLQAEEASLLKILGQSTNINSTLNVESRIQNVDQQINAVQSEILQTKTLLSFATIAAFLEEKAPTQPLTIKLTATPRSGESPLSVTFNAVTKGGSQPYIVNYNFGDGTSYDGQALIHIFQQGRHYNVTVTATDASANVTEASTLVDVSSPAATSTVGGFPSLVGGLFLQVVEGIAEVAVVIVPIVTVLLLVLFPLRFRLGLSSRKAQQGADSGGAPR